MKSFGPQSEMRHNSVLTGSLNQERPWNYSVVATPSSHSLNARITRSKRKRGPRRRRREAAAKVVRTKVKSLAPSPRRGRRMRAKLFRPHPRRKRKSEVRPCFDQRRLRCQCTYQIRARRNAPNSLSHVARICTC